MALLAVQLAWVWTVLVNVLASMSACVNSFFLRVCVRKGSAEPKPFNHGPYHVFLSHAGEQKKGVVFPLYEGLVVNLERDFRQANISVRVFLDREMEPGVEANDEMLQAAAEAKVGVCVLTPDYVSKKWPMLELHTFFDHEEAGEVVFPLWFGLDPGDCQGIPELLAKFPTIKDRWKKYEEKGNNWPKEKLLGLCKWTGEELIQRLPSRQGYKPSSKRQGDYRKDILDAVLRRLKFEGFHYEKQHVPNFIMEQGEDDVTFKNLLSDLRSCDGPGTVGITGSRQQSSVAGVYGMGGLGKTLLATRLYNDPGLQAVFKARIFWMTIGRPGIDLGQWMCTQQEALLRQLKGQAPKLSDPVEGKRQVENALREKFQDRRGVGELLLVLDDVWDELHAKQLGADVFSKVPGLRKLLITTRNRAVLTSLRAGAYEVELLPEPKALELFCWHAFRNRAPPEGLATVATEMARKCGGLPQLLVVLGAAAWGFESDESQWRVALKQLGRLRTTVNASHVDVLERLRVSYDLLDEELQDCFLDFAAYPQDERIEWLVVKDLWASRSSVDQAEVNLHSLVTRQMVKLNGLFLTLHDTMYDLALRLVRGGQVAGRRRLFQPDSTEAGFPREWLLAGGTKYAAEQMSLMCSAAERLPEDVFKRMPQLKVLLLNSSVRLLEIPNSIGHLSHLRHLDLGWCDALRGLPPSIASLSQLRWFSLAGCGRLASLPPEIGMLTNLVDLTLSNCVTLTSLPEELGNLTSLTFLDLRCCRNLRTFPEAIGGLTSLLKLYARDCNRLTYVPDSLGGLPRLELLDLSSCHTLETVPESFSGLTSLRQLWLTMSRNLESLPASLEALAKRGTLTEIDIRWTKKLLDAQGPAVRRVAGESGARLDRCNDRPEEQQSVREAAGISRLLNLARSTSRGKGKQERIAYALMGLAHNDVNRDIVTDLGGIAYLVDMLRDPAASPQCKLAALGALANTVRNSTARKELARAAAGRTLQGFFESGGHFRSSAFTVLITLWQDQGCREQIEKDVGHNESTCRPIVDTICSYLDRLQPARQRMSGDDNSEGLTPPSVAAGAFDDSAPGQQQEPGESSAGTTMLGGGDSTCQSVSTGGQASTRLQSPASLPRMRGGGEVEEEVVGEQSGRETSRNAGGEAETSLSAEAGFEPETTSRAETPEEGLEGPALCFFCKFGLLIERGIMVTS